MNRLARLCLLGLVAHTALGSQPSFSAGRTKLTLALEDSVRTFDPRQSVDANSQYVEDLVHCSLITFDAEGHSVPGIAAALPRWIKDDTLEISLRDGQPVVKELDISKHMSDQIGKSVEDPAR